MSAPTVTKAWTVEGSGSLECLKFNEHRVLPNLTANEVLVRFHAASLNFRDLMIAMGTYPFPVKPNVVPGSDGAGEVIAVGSKVTRFAVGDKFVTLFSQGHYASDLTPQVLGTGLGGAMDGTLQQHGIFNENGLSFMPKNLSFSEAGTLSCAPLTAWNALYGSKPVAPGDWVLTQGTGGVSIAGLQFAKAAGARVMATTSSSAKAETLKELGADHVINYKEIVQWGDEVKRVTGGGVQHVLEVGGAHTITQSLKAAGIGGIVTIIGWLGGSEGEGPDFPQILSSLATVRGIVVGSREQLDSMIRFIEAYDIKPVIDQNVFKLEDLKEAYQYLSDQKHFGKVVIEMA